MTALHYDPKEIWPHYGLAVNEWLEGDGVHTYAFRKVYVTVDGNFAGTMSFSTETHTERVMCYGQRDQMLGVPEAGEQAAAAFIAGYYRKGGTY